MKSYRRYVDISVLGSLMTMFSILSSYSAAANESLAERWTDAVRTRRWVTAFVSSPPDKIAVDRIRVKIGDEERIVYRAQPGDVELGRPILSPDGAKLAFLKTEEVDVRRFIFVYKLYAVDVDGRNLTMLLELGTTGFAMRGVVTPTSVAWSHDNRKLVVKKHGRAEQSPSPAPGVKSVTKLLLLDIPTGRVEELLTQTPRIHITPQSWAPDGRRLVYKSDDDHARILDILSREEIDLGPGLDPTWSPDGRFIAARLPGVKGKERNGDYELISTEPPYGRTTLMSNSRTLFALRGIGYAEPAMWSPDSRFLIMWYYPGEQGYPYVVERATGEIAKLPLGSVGESIGGRP